MGHTDNRCRNAISFRISNSATVQEDYQQMDFQWDRHISSHQKLPNKCKYIQISIQLSTKAYSSAYSSKKCTHIKSEFSRKYMSGKLSSQDKSNFK